MNVTPSRTGPASVLVVDDTLVILQLMQRLLRLADDALLLSMLAWLPRPEAGQTEA